MWLPMTFPILYSLFLSEDNSPLSLEVVKNTTKSMQLLASQFFKRHNPEFSRAYLLARFTSYHLAGFGWVPFVELHVWSLAVKQNAELMEVVKNSGPVFRHLWNKFHENLRHCMEPLRFLMLIPIVCIVSHSEDIRR